MSEYKLDSKTAKKILGGSGKRRLSKFKYRTPKVVVGHIIKVTGLRKADAEDEYMVDVFEEAKDELGSLGAYYSHEEFEGLQAKTRADIVRELTIDVLAQNHGTSANKLEETWNRGGFDDTRAREFREFTQQAVERYAQKMKVNAADLQGEFVSSLEFTERFS